MNRSPLAQGYREWRFTAHGTGSRQDVKLGNELEPILEDIWNSSGIHPRATVDRARFRVDAITGGPR